MPNTTTLIDDLNEILDLMKDQGVTAFKVKTESLELEVAFSPELTPLPLDQPEDQDDRQPSEDDLKFWSSR